jgi:hypothetical protein
MLIVTATPAELANLTGLPLVTMPTREEMVSAFTRAAAAYRLAMLKGLPGARILLADVVAIGREIDALGYELDEDAALYAAEILAEDIVYPSN